MIRERTNDGTDNGRAEPQPLRVALSAIDLFESPTSAPYPTMDDLGDAVKRPIVLRSHPQNGDRYLPLRGEQNLRAASSRGETEVQALIYKPDTTINFMLALVEAVQDESLAAVDRSWALLELQAVHGFSHQDCIEGIGLADWAYELLVGLKDLPPQLADQLRVLRPPLTNLSLLLLMEGRPDMQARLVKDLRDGLASDWVIDNLE